MTLKLVLIIGLVFTSAVKAQEKKGDLKSKRITHLSESMSISLAEARKIVEVLDAAREASNKIYNDSSLNPAYKIEKIKLIKKTKEQKLEEIAGPEKAHLFNRNNHGQIKKN